MDPPDLATIDWGRAIPQPSYSNRMSDDYKARAVLAVFTHLKLSPSTFLSWLVNSDDNDVKTRAGHLVSSARGLFPPLLDAIWTRFDGAKDGLERAIEPIVKDILERESKAAIHCRALNIRPGDVDLNGLLAKLGPGEDGIAHLIRTLMPRSYAWLLHATSADNDYRRKLHKTNGTNPAQSHKNVQVQDGCDEGDAFPLDGEDWHTDYPGFSRDPRLAVTFALSSLAFVRNRATNALPLLVGTQMTVHGANTRVMDTFSRLGAVVSRQMLDSFRIRLSDNSVARAIDAALADPRWLSVIDNVDLHVTKANQRVDNRNTTLHITNAALVMSHSSVSEAATSVSAFNNNRGKRAPAKPADIKPTKEDDAYTIQSFEAIVQSILVEHAPGAASWSNRSELRTQVAAAMPSRSPLTPEVTKTFPLGVLNANEGSNKGVLRALDLLRKRMEMSKGEWGEHLHVIAGDFLTIRNIRSARHLRQDDIDPVERLETIMPQAQLFHFQLNAVDMVLTAHLGDSVRDPGSLSKHKDVLMRTFNVNKADYANARALVRHSLIARVLQCIAQLLGFDSWERFKSWKPANYEEIKRVAAEFVSKFATSRAAEAAQDVGDDVLAHSILFIIDALRLWDLDTAISHADAGRILIIFKYLCFAFRGAGRHNYARECAEIYLHWVYELNDAQRQMWAASWFVNRWGLPGRFIPTDQYLEHLNFYVKVVHLADGSGVNVQNIIKKGSACIESLRDISLAVSRFVGSARRPRRHKESKFEHDLDTLFSLCQRKGVHILTPKPHRFLVAPPRRGKKVKRNPPPARSSVQSLFTLGVEAWNSKWDVMLRTSTFDPQLGISVYRADDEEGDIELNAADLGLDAADVDEEGQDLAVLVV